MTSTTLTIITGVGVGYGVGMAWMVALTLVSIVGCILGAGVPTQPTTTAKDTLHTRAIKYFKVFTCSQCCVDYILLYGLLKVRDKVFASPLEVVTPDSIHEAVQAINLIFEVLGQTLHFWSFVEGMIP